MATQSVAVVGHGPSGEGTNLGAEIDEHIVVRMINSSWQPVNDYGQRYDYGLFSPPMIDVDRIPDYGWWAYDPNGCVKNGVDAGDFGVTLLNHAPWVARARLLGARSEGRTFKLTRGCAAACAVITLLKPKYLALIGLDTIKNGKTVSPHYGPAAQANFDVEYAGRPHEFKPAGHEVEGAHDYAVERKLVETYAAENKTELQWLT